MSDSNSPNKLIGREQEMNELMQALAGTRAEIPMGCVAFVEGVGGLGKSVLMETFGSNLLAEGILYRKIELKTQESPENDQYRLIRELFDEMFLGEKKSLDRAEIWREVLNEIGNFSSVMPILSELLKRLISPINRAFAAYIKKEKQQIELPLDISKTNAARLAQAVKILRTALVRKRFRPTVLIADNFHMVDRESAALLLGLSGALGKMPIMIVCTYRPDELERRTFLRDLVHREFPALEAEGGMVIKNIPLTYLSLGETVKFFKARYPETDLPSQKTCFTLHKKTGGNPLILQEALSYLHNKGVLGDDVRSIEVLREIGTDIAKKGRHIIGLRVDHLKKESKEAYRIHTRASVAGEEFTSKVAGVLTDLDEITVMESLDEAIDTYRLVMRGEEEMLYRFRHALIHEEFFGRATKNKQLSKMLYQKAAKALEQYSESDPAMYNPVRIAELYLGAKEPAQAIKHLKKATQAAARAQAYHELAYLCRLLLSAMKRANVGTNKEHFDLLLILGRTYELLGSKVQAVNVLDKAVRLAEKMEEKVLIATALTFCSISLFHIGEHHKSNKTTNRALHLFQRLELH
ncbi:MAG: AAA family ATPase [Candidatus Aminicenantes bacterium]|nr:AAA family ATPase [Candidatus Aminicenantes bacterium]NIM80897.1 AAA family ATPase [Candidatus Aminicenantes bacterium]NIN20281.1 AAA family ATPase [Candidatus Aminicenantes bacterium]NIN44060.1 AAA family ATPase [Candidatus Aminicenantes bacterium]NIN86870.1 AAA family ATPase [Candidatus Aminicenantes bacterium]